MGPLFFLLFIVPGGPSRSVFYDSAALVCQALYEQFGGQSPDGPQAKMITVSMETGLLTEYGIICRPPVQVVPECRPYMKYDFDFQQK